MIPRQALTLPAAELSQLSQENKSLTNELITLVRSSNSEEFEDLATAADMLVLLQERVEFLRQELRYTGEKVERLEEEERREREKKERADRLAATPAAEMETQLVECRRVKASLKAEWEQLQVCYGKQLRELKTRTTQQRAQLLTNLP